MTDPPLRVVVLLPVRDDWDSASQLIRSLDRTVSAENANVRLKFLIVDDGSVEPWTAAQFISP